MRDEMQCGNALRPLNTKANMRNTDTADALNGRDARIVALTLAGKQPAAIAAELDCSVSTVYRRLQLGSVRAALAEACAGEVRPLVNQAIGEAQKSVAQLVEVREGEVTRDADRIRASVALLGWFRDVWQMAEVMPRLAALEARLAARSNGEGSAPDHNASTPTSGAVPPGLVNDDTELV